MATRPEHRTDRAVAVRCVVSRRASIVPALALCGLPGCARPATNEASQSPSVRPQPRSEGVSPATARTGDPAAIALLERVSVIGASQSAGFGEGEPFHQVLRAALRDDAQIFDASSSAHFVDAHTVGETQILAAKLRRPKLVIATDFLFWYAHGDKPFDQRLADLHEGMQLLASLDLPVLVGDLPDVSGASRRMIGPRQIPAPAERSRLNAEIEGWAAERPNITVLPLAGWMSTLMSGGPLSINGVEVDAEAGELLQWDGLHPTPRGQAALVLLVLSEFERAHGFAGPVVAQRDAGKFLARYEQAFAPPDASLLAPPPGASGPTSALSGDPQSGLSAAGAARTP